MRRCLWLGSGWSAQDIEDDVGVTRGTVRRHAKRLAIRLPCNDAERDRIVVAVERGRAAPMPKRSPC